MSGRGMAPPPKHPLVLGLGADKRDSLERRRVELERWLWRLVGTQDVARGPQLKSFLELDKAILRAQKQQQEQQRQRLEQQHQQQHSGVLGDDSASDASGTSGAASTAGALSSVTPAAMAAAAASAGLAGASGGAGGGGGPGSHYSMPPDPRVIASSLREHKMHEQHGGPPAAATAMALYGPGGAGAAGAAAAVRLGINLQSRGDVRRLVDLLVQKLDVACSEAASAASEVAMLRDANRAMAERLGELELERADREVQGPAVQQVAQLHSQLLEARTDNTELLRRLQEWDVGGSTSAVALAAADQRAEELRQQLDEQQQRLDEQQQRLDEQQRRMAEQQQRLDDQKELLDEQRRQMDELLKRLEEQASHGCGGGGEAGAQGKREEEEEQRGLALLHDRVRQLSLELEEAKARAGELQGKLEEQQRQLARESERRERAEAAAARQPTPPATVPQQPQALLERARADNALLAQEVQRLRTVAVAERKAHEAALATHSQASAQLAARVRQLEAQLAAAAAEATPPSAPTPTQELLLL
ncbi:hypothetical protein VOLCADRAFT_98084 [Volvox carteri f. nagariensis]|uniref:PX domain-containing protein n=1 Tax=Volvox carteri f. nagariensis TaxID=3068 RepID=D8UEE5_VOLCA|nr:uncharacterized protein VOLCADRAFT_98084 [Volvox carteri f. nagariensis]EFJ41830.1 hypothetical protein VOLCADRAFT_98084 [Volvox carteri f. nagariensis]|eukprot:XP_002957028.1 hypothetical protein VOLCADRAFT_98084 [Volvox carteri f. nagariensis]